ncbi:MAG: peptidoglycan DD-metalloendopeptidase family protein [Acidobacteria bacterium]|nr:peptidoglycan DD-metalloendopeptidase family protein [Acidobacteriota bacterium]
MSKDHRFYTLIITPATSSHFYKIILHHRQLYAISIGSLVGLALLTFTTIWVFKQAGLLINYHRIQSENQLLKQKQSIVLQKLQLRLASVEAESNQVRQIAAEMGLSLDEDLKTERKNSETGVGGPSTLDSFASELDRIASKLTLLRKNLGAEKVRLATTPKGWPASGRVNSRYGTRRDPFGRGYEFHSGVDIDTGYGRPVRATADGVVIYAGYQGGYGKLVVADHGRGIRTFYGHLSHITVSVSTRVQRGDQVGRVGSTGRATGAHVHYEIRVKDRPINPRKFSSAE